MCIRDRKKDGEEEGSAGDNDDDNHHATERATQKRQRVDDAERAWLLLREATAARNSKNNGEGNKRGGADAADGSGGSTTNATAKQREKSWLARYGATIIGNLVVTVTNVHIRYEDDITTPGHPFAAGITISRLAAITVDETGAESFVSSDSFSRVRKRVQLDRLAVYFDDGRAASCAAEQKSNANVQWVPERGWESMGPDDGAQWRKMFMPGIQSDDDDDNNNGEGAAAGRQYLLHPLGGELTYARKGIKDPARPGEPRQALDFRMGSVRCTLMRGPVSYTHLTLPTILLV